LVKKLTTFIISMQLQVIYQKIVLQTDNTCVWKLLER